MQDSDPLEKGNKWGDLTIVQDFDWGQFSDHRLGKQNANSALKPSWIKETNQSPEKLKSLNCRGQSREEKFKSSRDLIKGSLRI